MDELIIHIYFSISILIFLISRNKMSEILGYLAFVVILTALQVFAGTENYGSDSAIISRKRE